MAEAILISILYAALSGVATGAATDFVVRGSAALSKFLSQSEDDEDPLGQFLAVHPDLQRLAQERREQEFCELAALSFQEASQLQKREILARLTSITGYYQDDRDSILPDDDSDGSVRLPAEPIPPPDHYRYLIWGSIADIEEQLTQASLKAKMEQARYQSIREQLVTAFNEEWVVSEIESQQSFKAIDEPNFEETYMHHKFGFVRELAQCKRQVADLEGQVRALEAKKAVAEADIEHADKNPAELYRHILELRRELQQLRLSHEVLKQSHHELARLRESHDELKRSLEGQQAQLRSSYEMLKRVVDERFAQDRKEHHESVQELQRQESALDVICSSSNVTVQGHLIRHSGPAISHEFALGGVPFSEDGRTRLTFTVANIPSTGYLLIGVISNSSPSSPSSIDSSSYGWWSNAGVNIGGMDVVAAARARWPDGGWQTGDEGVLELVHSSFSPVRLKLEHRRLGSFSLDLPRDTPFRWHVYIVHPRTAVSVRVAGL